MKKQKLLYKVFIILLILVPIFFQSCRKSWEFKEFSNTTTDSMLFEGTIAVPVLDTKFTLETFIPDTDSTLWAEIDAQNLVHIKMYFKDLVLLQMNQIYTAIPYPAASGTPVPAGETSVRTDTSKLKIYTRMIEGRLYFNDPKITFIINNQIPVVTFFRLDTLIFHDLDGNVLSNNSDKDYIISAPTASGTSSVTEILIDKTEIPVLPEAFSPVPKYVSFYLTAGSNSLQTLPYGVTGAETVKVDADFDLPLDARLEDLVMGDTMENPLDADAFSQVETATLKIKFNNGFPLEGRTQIYFADTTSTGEINTFIDSLFTDLSQENIYEDGWRFVSAQTGTDGIVTQNAESTVFVTLTQERLNALKDAGATKMIILSKLNTYNSTFGTFIKLLSTYQLGIKASVIADYSVTTGE